MNTSDQLEAMLARYEAELGELRERTDDGITALLVAAVGGALLLIVLVIAAVAAGNAL